MGNILHKNLVWESLKISKWTSEAVNWRRTNKYNCQQKKVKHWSTKKKTENLRLSKQNPTKAYSYFEAGKTNDIKSLSYQECVLDNKRADIALCYTTTMYGGWTVDWNTRYVVPTC